NAPLRRPEGRTSRLRGGPPLRAANTLYEASVQGKNGNGRAASCAPGRHRSLVSATMRPRAGSGRLLSLPVHALFGQVLGVGILRPSGVLDLHLIIVRVNAHFVIALGELRLAAA